MKIKSKNLRKKSVAILAGLAIAGAVGASAASLGGINSDELGADTGDVVSCDTDGIDVDYDTAFDPASGEYIVTSINLSAIDLGCIGQTFDLSVLGDPAVAGAPDPVLVNKTGLIVAPTGTQSISTVGDSLTAESVTGLAMSISGAVPA